MNIRKIKNHNFRPCTPDYSVNNLNDATEAVNSDTKKIEKAKQLQQSVKNNDAELLQY